MLVLPERGHRIKGLPRTATGGPWSPLPHAGIGDVPKLPTGFQQRLKNSHPLTPPQAYYGEGREFFNLTYPIVCGDQAPTTMEVQWRNLGLPKMKSWL
jgi:hypothetical protein